MIGNRIIVFLIFFIFIFLSGCTENENDKDNNSENLADKDVASEPVELSLEKINTYFTKTSDNVDAYWMRSGWFYWNDVEPEKDEYNWDFADSFMCEHLEKAECLLVVIFPYANWDQNSCHGDEYIAEFDKEKGGSSKVGKPCDMQKYKDYLKALVERYDGDGIDDMPGLKIPIKYWEICNEPSMQGGVQGGMGEDLKFFYGTSEEYVEILKTSYEAIKQADPDAKVLHAGMAGMDQNFQDFWDPIYATEDIGNYFDIANIHTISTTEKREDLFIDKYTAFLNTYGLEDKPIWITELQIGDLVDIPEDTASFNRLMVKSSIFSLALGADKLFHVVNWGKGSKSGTNTNIVYDTLLKYMNSFDSFEIISQGYNVNEGDYNGLTSVIGHYKITNKDNVFYVLWGGTEIPEEITGPLKVTDIYGASKTIDATELTLTKDPVYIEFI